MEGKQWIRFKCFAISERSGSGGSEQEMAEYSVHQRNTLLKETA